ncbi:MAG: sigma 54-interacting transcriptional regulator [Candidatus Polarisedimenticolia bacterium]
MRAYVCDTASVEAIGNKLFELTKGNPFLLTEALNQLAFQLRPTKRVRGGFALMIDDSHLPVETTFTSLARSALSTLSARSRELLRLMSIDPDPLDSRLLSRYSGDSRIDITATLSELHDKGIVQAVETTFATAYAIRHEYLRHHVYSSISAVSRRRLHLDLATLLESFPPLHQDARLDKIAFHHLAAMDRTHGPQLAMQAAKRAMSQFATSKAIEWLTQALLIMPSDQNDLRFEVLETLGALHWLTGDLAKSQEAYQEMLLVSRLTNRPSKEALAIRELAWVLAEVGDLPRSLSYAKLAESAYDALDDLKGATRAVLIQAQSLRKKGDLAEASHLCRRALASAERTTDVYCQSLGLVLEGLIENDLGNQDTALRHLLAAKSLKEQINDVAGLVIVLNNIGLVYLEQGRVQQAEPYFRSCLDEAKSKGLSLACTLSSINLGEACLHTGQLSTAAQLLNEAHALAQASSRRQFAAYSLLVLGIVNTVNGCYEQAVAHLTNSERDLADSGAHSDRCLALLALADLYSKLGLKDQSRRVMFEAEVLARRVESLRVRTTFACLQSTLAETHLLPLIAEARAGGRILDLVDLLLRQAQVRGFHPNADVQSLLSEAYSLAHANKLRIAEGRILLSKGICLYSHSPEEASECFRLASDLFRSFGARSLLLEALYQCARLAERDHQRKASFALEEASSLFGELASEIADENTRASYLGTYEALQSTLLANRSHTGCAIQSFSDTSLSNGERTEGGDSYSSATPLPTLITTLLDQAIQTIGAESGHLLVSSGTELRVLVTRNARGALGIDSQSSVDRFAMHVLDRSVVNSDRSEMTCPLRLGGRVRGAVHFKAWANGLPFQDSDMESVRAQIDQIERSIVAAQRHSIQVIVSTRTTSPVFSRHSLLGESPAMQKLFKMMDAVIKADCNVLLVGESGTGKELVARSIHFGGRRKTGEFVPLDCGAIPENLVESELFGHRRGAFSGADTDKKGLLEEADGGTLFLDEVTNTSLSFQAKLLRALQSGEFRRLGENAVRRVDARIIAATNMDIESVIKDGRFREDLYYRLNVVTLRLPPLRERQSDIPMLAEYFARRFCEERGMAYKGIGRGALLRLQAYAWPGNVRELEHAVHAALVVSGDGMVRRDALPERILGDSLDEVRDLLEVATLSVGSHAGAVEHDLAVGSTTSTPRDDEKARIEDALRQAGGDKSAAARILGWTAMNTQKTPPARDRVLQFLRDEGSWKKCG